MPKRRFSAVALFGSAQQLGDASPIWVRGWPSTADDQMPIGHERPRPTVAGLAPTAATTAVI
jgi:hypothetical protein